MSFPSGSVVKSQPANAGGMGLIHGWGTKIPHAAWSSRKMKTNK